MLPYWWITNKERIGEIALLTDTVKSVSNVLLVRFVCFTAFLLRLFNFCSLYLFSATIIIRCPVKRANFWQRCGPDGRYGTGSLSVSGVATDHRPSLSVADGGRTCPYCSRPAPGSQARHRDPAPPGRLPPRRQVIMRWQLQSKLSPPSSFVRLIR